MSRVRHGLRAVAVALLALPLWAGAQQPMPGTLGPYDLVILQGGIGMVRSLPTDTPILAAGAPWSLAGWVRNDVEPSGMAVVAAVGDPASGPCLCLWRDSERVGVRAANGAAIEARKALPVGSWHALAATFDGQVLRLYVDGRELASAPASTASVAGPALAALLHLGPVPPATDATRHFGGALAGFHFRVGALTPQEVQALAGDPPPFALVHFNTVGSGWPLQARAWIGLTAPQDAWTLPRANTPPDAPRAIPAESGPALQAEPGRTWTVRAWRLAGAPQVDAAPGVVSQPGFDDAGWYAATVPGTVLTTLVDRGVYPDPDHALNNMAIPESLARQDWWYRSKFTAPDVAPGTRMTLTFKGINYAAEAWLNGARLGEVRGAFLRGVFDVTRLLRPGQPNALAVRVSPPPHPGIPSEESVAFGPGENGGSMALDGPTFVASEGWDWIPGIRDRNTGLWQPVQLHASGEVRLLDPQVITQLPLPRTDEATVKIVVPLHNASDRPRTVVVSAAFEGVALRKQLTLAPGDSQLTFDAQDFPQLRVRNPRLWWPNGYGAPELYHLTLDVADDAGAADEQSVRFGIRQLTYELSLFDHEGRLRRVEVDPTAGALRGERLVDVRHEAIRQVPNGWAASLTAAGETSPAVRPVASESLAPFLVIRVNGVPIAVRGGSWGMDDARKRISRARLEPYFRLHREAHVNIIRNWLGQNTEDVFYDLADEYGLLVLNDFWASTQDFQIEPQDPALFLANARDVLLRYRNHPSIVAWFGRNEGVPQPIINEGLDDLVATLDGTRYYTGSSNRVNLQDSGPYNYRDPVGYFTNLAQGFSVEVGTPSLATLESIEATVPPADRWPLGDVIAYHDWHFGGNGDVATFMAALERQFGAATSLEDFERKAQMLNYVDYRAIFEGFQAHLWTRNSGRLLWMTHPAWPSNHWQAYSADYDTQASYYGLKKAAEPLHAQMNLPDYALAVVNTTREARSRLVLTARVRALDSRVLATRRERLDAPANQVTTLAPLALAPLLEREGMVLVELVLEDASGLRLSQNTYWQGRDEASARRLNELEPQAVRVRADSERDGREWRVRVTLGNEGRVPVLAAKLTLLDASGRRILPAYYSDNYLALMPGERRSVEVRCAAGGALPARIALRGWNVVPAATTIRSYGQDRAE